MDHDSAYLQFPSDPDFVDSDKKFIVAHEYGHAFGTFFGPHQFFGPNYNYETGDSDCLPGNPAHSINSMEWSLDAAFEGWGNFVSAMVWNYGPSEFGSYNGHEMASYEVGGFYGGFEENICLPCTTCADQGDGSGVESDWMRAFWDFYTNDRTECSNPPSSTDVARFWGNLLDLDLDHPEGWEGSVDAVQQLAADGHVGGCFATRWYWKGTWGDDSISHWNGLRQEWPY